MKSITVFFDLEAPFLWKCEDKFNLEQSLQNISDVLSQFKVKAVLNTCGVVANAFPQLIKMLHDKGHEVASHGYAHENFAKMSTTELDDTLSRTERILQGIIGEKPVGVRAPWLLTNEKVFDVLNRRKYAWSSNMHIPFWATKSQVEFGGSSYLKWMLGRTIYEFKRFFQRKDPFRINSLLEIPLLSPMDIFCIYPFPQANKSSPLSSLEEAYGILVRHYNTSKTYFNLNFHEHIIGTTNRIQLLEKTLRFLSEQPDASFVLPCQLASSSC